jgi:hypothetical protein
MRARRSLVFAVFTAALALNPASKASAQDRMQVAATDNNSAALVFSPDAQIFGQSYSEWAEQWYLWWDLIPVANNPSYDPTGQNCNTNQSRPVFFLAGDGTFNGKPVTRSCTVPSVPLFFPMLTGECSNVEAPPFFGRTDADRLECARQLVDGIPPITVVVTVDGKSVPALRNFRVASPPFNFTTPAHDNVLGVDGVTSGRSGTDGYWAMLTPLRPGKHTVHFEAAISAGPFAGLTQNVTYNLTVR